MRNTGVLLVVEIILNEIAFLGRVQALISNAWQQQVGSDRSADDHYGDNRDQASCNSGCTPS